MTIRATVVSSARGHDAHPVARTDAAADDLAGEAAEVEVRPVHPLHRHAQRADVQVVGDLDRFEVPDAAWARRTRACAGSASVMLSPRSAEIGMADDVVEPDVGGEAPVVGLDGVEHLLGVVDEVHLVDRQHHVADAEQRHEEAVPPGLGEHPLAGVDQDHREVRGGRAGDHVAGVLLVAGGVGDDELALLGGEEAVGDVDGDALLALGGEPVDQQGEVEVAALGPEPLRVGLERRQLVLEDQLGLVEQPADQRALAVVDAAAGDEAQQRSCARGAPGRPRCRRRGGRCDTWDIRSSPPASSSPSMPLESWSITRPWRSEVVASSISWMIAVSVSAVLSTAPVSG